MLSLNEHNKGDKGRQVAGRSHSKDEKECYFCGKEPHPREKCPARRATCSRCRKVGHWSKVCKNKSVRAVGKESDEYSSEEEDNQSQNGFIGLMVGSNQNSESISQWFCKLDVEGFSNKIRFLVDTGADLTCMPEKLVPENILINLKNRMTSYRVLMVDLCMC